MAGPEPQSTVPLCMMLVCDTEHFHSFSGGCAKTLMSPAEAGGSDRVEGVKEGQGGQMVYMVQ